MTPILLELDYLLALRRTFLICRWGRIRMIYIERVEEKMRRQEEGGVGGGRQGETRGEKNS